MGVNKKQVSCYDKTLYVILILLCVMLTFVFTLGIGLAIYDSIS